VQDPLAQVLRRQDVTPQSEPIPGSTQVANSAGGYSFAIDKWGRLDRFLVLGTAGGTYYTTEQKLTKENAEVVFDCLAADPVRVVDRVVEVSQAGRAPKNNAALFVLAAAFSDEGAVRRCDLAAALQLVARTGTHLFTFATYAQNLRGWGRSLRRAVAEWYEAKPLDALAYQLVKYRQRDGWTHRDLLRLAHPANLDPALALFATGRPTDGGPAILEAFHRLQSAPSAKIAAEIVATSGLPWEAVPSEHLAGADVWRALIDADRLPITALFRNLGRMTANGTLVPMGGAVDRVVAALSDADRLKAGRVHPIQVLSALITYAQGHGTRGSLTWEPVQSIIDALDSAFYQSFQFVEPTGKRTLLALDVSGSMTWGEIAGVPGLTPRSGSAAMALVTAATEPRHHIMGFSHELVPVPISPKSRLDDAIRVIEQVPYGATDCSLPMVWAHGKGVEVDTFVVYTDNETWAGRIHPVQALIQYRRQTGIDAKLVVVGMTATEFSIADPDDKGMLDVVGFDSAAPAVIADFSR
jgi:60 kDa SS-A/Ro ribonucleoprotein